MKLFDSLGSKPTTPPSCFSLITVTLIISSFSSSLPPTHTTCRHSPQQLLRLTCRTCANLPLPNRHWGAAQCRPQPQQPLWKHILVVHHDGKQTNDTPLYMCCWQSFRDQKPRRSGCWLQTELSVARRNRVTPKKPRGGLTAGFFRQPFISYGCLRIYSCALRAPLA